MASYEQKYGGYESDESGIYDYEPEQSMEMEQGAFERAGVGQLLGTVIQEGGTVAETLKKAMKEIDDPEERFKIFVNMISLHLRGEKIISITDTNIRDMLENISRMSGIKYKNPTAYILAFLATNGGQYLDIARIKEFINILPNIPEDIRRGVEPPDLVRYARYLHMLNV